MVGFPHSEIPGSKPVRGSPRLIAAYYVLHRLHAPRHPLDALKALDRSHYRCPQHSRRSCTAVPSSGRTIAASRVMRQYDRSDHKNQNSRAAADLPGVRVKQSDWASLNDVERSGGFGPRDRGRQTLLFVRRNGRKLVEPIGIEPTTSCLQSTRSPN